VRAVQPLTYGPIVANPVDVGLGGARAAVTALAGKTNLLKQAGQLRRNSSIRTPITVLLVEIRHPVAQYPCEQVRVRSCSPDQQDDSRLT
jgi:hypothetical protein